MQIRVLGAHNTESIKTRMSCILIDDKLALDAGSLASGLSTEAQTGLKAVCLTHAHYDHVRDIPALGMNLYLNQHKIDIYATKEVYNALTQYLLNDDLYPNWFNRSVFKYVPLEPYQLKTLGDYGIMAVPVNHPVPSVGYHITHEDRTLFYTGDTGIGLVECWQHVSPQLLITEVTSSNRYEESIGNGSKHLTPRLLQRELELFRKIKGYLPQVLLVHMYPPLEKEIIAEIAVVVESLQCAITLAYEGMKVKL